MCCSAHGRIHTSSWTPIYMMCSCRTATLALFQCHCFLFTSAKSLWFGLLCPRCIYLDSPSGSLGSQGGTVWDKHSEFPVMSPDFSFTMLSLTPHGELYLPDYYYPAEAAPCNSIWDASHSSFLWGIQMNLFEFHGWWNLFMKLNFCIDVAYWSLDIYWHPKQIQ